MTKKPAYIYAVEISGYDVTYHQINVISAHHRHSIYKYTLERPVYVDDTRMSNILPAEKLKKVISISDAPLSTTTSLTHYHSIAYFENRNEANKYLDIAKNLRDIRLNTDIDTVKAKLDELETIRNKIKQRSYQTACIY